MPETLRDLFDQPDKLKGLPDFEAKVRRMMCEEDKQKLLTDLQHQIDQYIQLSTQLRTAKKENLGCSLALDSFYLAPAILSMLTDLAEHQVTSETLVEAFILIVIAMMFVGFFNLMVADTSQKKQAKSHKQDVEALVTTYETRQIQRKRVRQLSQKLDDTSKEIRTLLKLTRLNLHSDYSSLTFNQLVTTLDQVLKEYEREQKILERLGLEVVSQDQLSTDGVEYFDDNHSQLAIN